MYLLPALLSPPKPPVSPGPSHLEKAHGVLHTTPHPEGVGFHLLYSLSLLLCFTPGEASFFLVRTGVFGIAEASAS